jgi:hypothetical protein
MAIAMVIRPDAASVPVAVQFPEGITHGFLQVRSTAGDIIGQGEMTQMLDQDDEVPAFVRFEAPLQLMGPILSIELMSPRLHRNAEQGNLSRNNFWTRAIL